MTADTIDTRLDDRLRWFVGSLNRIVASASETNGTFGLMEQWARRGFAPPTHVHHGEDSALYVLEGSLRVRVGEDESTITARDFVFLPRDVPHSFRVDSEDQTRHQDQGGHEDPCRPLSEFDQFPGFFDSEQ